jgi:tetratricopeptide (TPR) repeat protein
MRDWPHAQSSAQRLIALAPDSINAKAQVGYVEFWATGSTERLKSEMATVPAGKDPDGGVTACRWDANMIDRDVSAADKILRASSLETFSYFNAVDTPRSYLAGSIALLRGDNAVARKELEHARNIFAAAAQEAPEVPERHAFLGLACALLGDKERAIQEGKRAVELRPESRDALDGTVMNALLAVIYARVGEKDRAIELLEHLIAVPGPVDSANYSISLNDLKFRWEWDPIRNDPRFQKLIAASAEAEKK